MKSQGVPKDVDSYIHSQSHEVRDKLVEIRHAIQSAAPKAEELISYQMPAYKLNGILVYFAACKNHIGFYPTGAGTAAFEDELSAFKYSKGAIQFPLDRPLPVGLIKRIVKFRVKQNSEAAKMKAAKAKVKGK